MSIVLAEKQKSEKNLNAKTGPSLSIRDLLKIPTELRTFQHCKDIITHVKDVKFLERYMDSEQIYDLAKEFRLQSFEPNTVVFRQGEFADAFYIILSGAVKVYINTPSEVKHFQNLKEIMQLQKGDAFGELALIYDSVRSATIITTDYTDLIVLDKDNFRKHIRTVQTSHISQIMDFYKNFAAFQSLSPSQIANYAGKSLLHKFPSNTAIIRQGELPTDIFFISSGRAKVVRRIKFKVDPYSRNLLLNDPEEPTPVEIEMGNYKSMLIEVDELSNGDSFCDLSVLNKEPMHHSIITSIPCELITLPVYEVNQLPETVIKEYKSICKPYPDDTELRRVYLDMLRWENWKKRLVHNIKIEKHYQKRGYDKELRKPVMKLKPIEKLSLQTEQDNTNELLEILASTNSAKASNQYLRNMKFDDAFESLDSFTNRSRLKNKKSTVIEPLKLSMDKSSTHRQPSISFRSEISPRKFDFVVPKHSARTKPKVPEINLGITEDRSLTFEGGSGHTNVNNTNGTAHMPMKLPMGIIEPSTNTHRKKTLEDTFTSLGFSSINLGQIKTLPAANFDKVFNEIGLGGINCPNIWVLQA